MPSPLQVFRHELGAQVSALLRPQWRFSKTHMEFVRKDEYGSQKITLGSVAKFSPWVDFSVHFWREFSLEPKAVELAGLLRPVTVGNNSHNRQAMKGLPVSGGGRSTWPVNVGQPVPKDLAQELMRFIDHTVMPFFALFHTPHQLLHDWAQGKHSDGMPIHVNEVWPILLALSIHVQELGQFESWLNEQKKLSNENRLLAMQHLKNAQLMMDTGTQGG